jgi:hypothetical protein
VSEVDAENLGWSRYQYNMTALLPWSIAESAINAT